ncbi:MAG: phospho-sugar mutase [Firmicutes bacterium]|nr:phospho-sugar mutase [Bacillota bacterium]
MTMEERYSYWRDNAGDGAVQAELEAIRGNESAIRDRFWRELTFGTGGLRGEIGAGSNRMNVYTVGRATQGLADYLLAQKWRPLAVIAYDTRHMSREFAERAACVLCANGIDTRLFDSPHPTPMLSFAVRNLKADAGIVITASHNPKQYNGYKVYGPDGGQITDTAASAILKCIEAVDLFKNVKAVTPEQATGSRQLVIIGEEVDTAYFAKVKSLVMRRELLAEKAGNLKILYSPLHGSGNIPVRRVLRELGFSRVDVVKAQELPDGDFPTAPYPNPEEPAVYQLAIELAKVTGPDLIFATDPDCDRIGILCRTPGGSFEVLTGNQTGALLCEYILQTKRERGELPVNAAVIKTIVTTELATAICRRYGAALADTLTGFKYIGELAEEWSHSGEQTFMFGFEESYGYLAGDFVRDKDAVIAAALIAEMALYHKARGRTLYEALEELFQQYGYYSEKLVSISMPGKEGQERIARIIAELRAHYLEQTAGLGLAVFEDYRASEHVAVGTGESRQIRLPKSDVLKFIFDDESWLVMRPSGTEPKIKIYVGVKSGSRENAHKRLTELEALANRWGRM